MTAKHTPGPWEVVVPYDGLWPPRILHGSKLIAMINNSDDTQENRIADANLMGASPDMLAALETMRDNPTIAAVCPSPLWAQMINAIEKARGTE